MPTLNRNNSNWSFEERRKINENWEILEGVANSANNTNNGLKQEVDQLKETASINTTRSTNALQIANQAKAESSTVLSVADDAKREAENALNVSNEANFKSNNAEQVANDSKQTAETVQTRFNEVVAEAGNNNPEVVQARNGNVNLNERLSLEYTETNTKIENVADISATNLDALSGIKSNKYIAHRGVSALAPENTLPAFRLAANYGFWGVECDVRRTSDGVWIVMHDETVDRTTNGTGRVDQMTYAQIQQLTIDEGKNIGRYPNLKVPTMAEYLTLCKQYNLVPVIEVVGTTPGLTDNYQSFVDLLRLYNFEETAVVISFSTFYLRGIRAISKKIPMQLIGDNNQKLIDDAISITNCDIDIFSGGANKAYIDLAHRSGLKIGVYTVNNYQEAIRLINLSIDFITSDIIAKVEV